MIKIPARLVCIFAHPDDEAFGPGGTIAYFSKRCKVYIICVTKGDSHKKFTSGNLSGTDLGNMRRDELKNSAKILGVSRVYFLDFKDGSLNNNNYHEVAKKLKRLLDKIEPDALLTFNLDGVSGHLDHVAVAMETSYLFEKLTFVKRLYLFIQNSKAKTIFGSSYFVYHPPGFLPKDADWVNKLSDGIFDVKINAMEAHESQKDDYIRIKSLLGDLLRTEMFKIISK